MGHYNSKYNTEYARAWRQEARRVLIKALGEKCLVCGYDKCPGALDFHHVDKEEKDDEIGKLMAQKSWAKIVREVRKCILVCCRCHREIHCGAVVLEPVEMTYNIPDAITVWQPRYEKKPCPVTVEELRALRQEHSFDDLAILLRSNKRTVMRWCQESLVGVA